MCPVTLGPQAANPVTLEGMAKAFFVTTPIYYVNGDPHVGTTLTTVVADVVARYHRARGEKVVYLTGTDENGTKVAEAAASQGKTAQEWVDFMSQKFIDVFDQMNVSADVFMRTTSEQHHRTVQALFSKLQENGHIYLDKYSGWYDVSSESFVRESDLVDGKSPEGNEVRWVEEENWFFRLSAFGEPLLRHAEANPEFWMPESRRNEVVSFVRSGLRDMCVTRANSGWGIPVPGDSSKVIYVWFDALINYLSASGWPDNPDWEELWPADVHLMAKEIFTRFHATLWPAMLMGAELPLPRQIVAHGWFNFGDEKMSKSKGNVIEPLELADEIVFKTSARPEIARDAVRHALIALMPYEGDSNFTRDEVDRRYNADLANDLGNALNRTLAMMHKFVDGEIQSALPLPIAVEQVTRAKQAFEQAMAEFRVNSALEAALELPRFLNKFIDDHKPWDLAKNQDPSLAGVMNSMIFMLQAAATLLDPVMPTACAEIRRQLAGKPTPPLAWESMAQPATLIAGVKVATPEPIFPRIDPKKKAEMEATQKPTPEPVAAPEKPKKAKFEPPESITIEDFMKVSLKVARVLEAEPVEGSSKLLKLQVMIGEEKRQILAGIQKNYTPMDLIGRQVIVVANLKPAKLMGLESQGMVLAADGPEGSAILLQPESEAPEGTSVH